METKTEKKNSTEPESPKNESTPRNIVENGWKDEWKEDQQKSRGLIDGPDERMSYSFQFFLFCLLRDEDPHARVPSVGKRLAYVAIVGAVLPNPSVLFVFLVTFFCLIALCFSFYYLSNSCTYTPTATPL